MPSSMVEGPPIAIEQATPTAVAGAQIGLGRPVRAQRQPRRAPPRVATLEVEEIVQKPAQAPQVLRTVIQRGDDFDMLEEGEASEEAKRLRADLSAMIG